MSDFTRRNSLTFNSADFCRENGYGPGTRLVGDEGYGPTVIEITAVGEWGVLAKCVEHDGEPPRHGVWENKWTLAHRDWREVGVSDERTE